MFAPCRADQEPDLTQLRVAAHVVDVPTRGRGASVVMSEPAAEPARTERAADVGVESGLEIECTESTHWHSVLEWRFEDEDVGTWLGRNRSDRRFAQSIPRGCQPGCPYLGAQLRRTGQPLALEWERAPPDSSMARSASAACAGGSASCLA